MSMILLEDVDTEFGNIKIMRSERDGICTYYQNDCFHSQADKKGVSTCAYVHIMHKIIEHPMGRRVLMIGCAGGTLATMLHRIGCEVTVVDINAYAFTLAKRYFQMPEEVQCITEDGWTYLLTMQERYDAIAIDAFDSGGLIPEQFTSEDFFRLVQKGLAPEGIVAMNVMTAHDLDLLADRIALTMENTTSPVILFDQPGKTDRNTIIAGGIESLTILSGKEPAWLKRELKGFVQRSPRK